MQTGLVSSAAKAMVPMINGRRDLSFAEALKKVSPGRNSTTNSGVVSNCSQ